MISYSFYHKVSGAIHPKSFGTDDPKQLAGNIPPDHIAVEGAHDHRNKRFDIERNVVVEYIPPQPSPDHEWDDAEKLWTLEAATIQRQQKRAAALSQIAALESSGVRAMREAQLGQPGAQARLAALDAEIVRARADLT